MLKLNGRRDNRRGFFKRAAGLAAGLGVWGASARGCPWCSSDPDDPLASLPRSVWNNARQNGLVMIRHPAPRQFSSHAQLVSDREPGERLVVMGQVFGPDRRTPAAGVTLHAYNTDAAGYYGENRAEYPPRIYGWMRTGADGRFDLQTIHPGHYPAMQVPAHIHFAAWGAGFPPQWVDELQFAGDRYLTAVMLEQDATLGPFRRIQPLVRDGDIVHCAFRFRLQRESNFH
jgi:protocatechuate 3,4-dioxygenase beta subunit